jgi:DNA invertase Pin-like site-specific DNA recombinase
VPASLAELELELGRERRAAAREARRARGQHIGRPKALDAKKAGLAQRMHANGESASTIANALGVSRATVTASWPNKLLKAIENMLRRSRVGHATRATQLGCSSSVRAWSIWS